MKIKVNNEGIRIIKKNRFGEFETTIKNPENKEMYLDVRTNGLVLFIENEKPFVFYGYKIKED